jgi:CheY-like chemotaxis protein
MMSLTSQPLILVVCADAAKYSACAATIDVAKTAAMAQMSLHGARLLGQHYDAVLVDERIGDLSGYDIVQTLRQSRLHEGEFYLVAQVVSSLDLSLAQRVGASVVGADRHSIQSLLETLSSNDTQVPTTPAPKAARSNQPQEPFSEPTFVPQVINAMREFLASEAEPRVKSLYQAMQGEKYPNGVSFDELVSQAAQRLLDDVDDRHAFVKYVHSQRGRNR